MISIGSICYINKNPRTWHSEETSLVTKKEYGSEELVKICYGEFDDFPAPFELTMLMRKSIYNKLISGEYKVSSDCHFNRELTVIDRNNNKIEPLNSAVY